MEYVKGGEEKLEEANTSHVQLDEAIADVNTISSSPLHNSDQPISLIDSVLNFFMRNVCLRFFFKRKIDDSLEGAFIETDDSSEGSLIYAVDPCSCETPTFDEMIEMKREWPLINDCSCETPTFDEMIEMKREWPLINDLSCKTPTFDKMTEMKREGPLINEVGTTFILRHRANLTESKEVLNHPDEVIGKADAVCEICWIPFSVNEDITKMKCKCEFFYFHETCVPKMGNTCSTCLQQVEGIPLTLLQFQDLAVDGTSKQNEKKPRKFLLFKFVSCI